MVSSLKSHRANGPVRKIVHRTIIQLEGVEIEVHYKWIRGLHLRVYPSTGNVVVSAPVQLSDEQVRAVVLKRMDWIRRHRERLRRIEPFGSRDLAAGGVCRVWGRSYWLDVFPNAGKPIVECSDDRIVVRASALTSDQLATLLEQWYRVQLRKAIPKVLTAWEPVIGVKASAWGIRRMKTRWGSCNAVTAKIWINLELAKYHPDELEYVVVHELTHLLESNHGPRFRALLDMEMPDWRLRQDRLNGLAPQYVD